MADANDTDVSRPPRHGMSGIIWMLEHAQDYVAVVVAILLVGLAATLIVSGIIGFFLNLSAHGVSSAATRLLDQMLLVLILGEIVHTVVLSLREHRLAAQPFIIVGLVAVIRKILLVLSSETTMGTAQLALLIAMVAAFVIGLIAVSRFEKRDE